MIIQVRGTSGSGKSTVVAGLVHSWNPRWRVPVRIEGRKQPLGYWLERKARHPIAVPGHYETACGGCDTLPTQAMVFDLIRRSMIETKTQSAAAHVVFEGLLASEEVRRTVALHEDHPGQLRVLQLDTNVEECIRAIKQRRAERGDDRPLKEDNTRNRVGVINRACERLRAAGVDVRLVSREQAARLVAEWTQL